MEILNSNGVHWRRKIHKVKRIFGRSRRTHDRDQKAPDQEIRRQNWSRLAATWLLMSSRTGLRRERRATRRSSRFKEEKIHRSTKFSLIRHKYKNNTKKLWNIWEQRGLQQMPLPSRQAQPFRCRFLFRASTTGWIRFWRRNRRKWRCARRRSRTRADAQGNHWNQGITIPRPEAGQERRRRSKTLRAIESETGAQNAWSKYTENKWVRPNRIRGLKLHQKRRARRKPISSSANTSKLNRSCWKRDPSYSKPISS